ncbi:tape measure protein [Eoetvoesiella caeni]|uniref:Tape measure domain-containing protein n=1 Tax=Eoetvoesiella caeni TaxID=645616 RepID=A0A366HAP1_9BURK|nr:tape measure protein [Eoetvoesiella caeni]MCI2809394.1 tape measure protein [Eoetvoesiella caeni]NYT54535.1 tape measure protein [Eoetvoesiella caeni]RBP39275.1 tape measure domain-containing protein [Eoetvoesiella caeni]
MAAQGENVGGIYYEVEADTSKLVNSSQSVDKSLDGMNKRFAQTDKAAAKADMRMTKVAASVQRMGRESGIASVAMGALAKVVSGIVSLKTAVMLVQMAEAYNEMAERIAMATNGTREFNMVQDRLLSTANGTYRALSEAQEVYIRTADSLRSMGYSTEQVLDITDSLSYLFVTNAASADRASTAISAYSKAINKGKVESDAWESIIAATPSIINDIAEASGKSAAKIRELGASGKITAKELNEGLRQSLQSNKAAADGMATTVKDALVAVRNNLSVLVGKANQATGVTDDLATAIKGVAEAIQSVDVNELVRQVDALQVSMVAVNDLAGDWLKPFMVSTDEAASYLPKSFADSVLNTAKEIDGLSMIFTGTVGAIQGIWQALANNIPAFFKNAYNSALSDAASFVNGLADIINQPLQAFGREGIGKVSFGAGEQKKIIRLADAAKQGWNNAAKSAGAYAAIAGGMEDRELLRSVLAWGEAYETSGARAKSAIQGATDATEKLTAAQKKAIKDQEANKKAIDDLAQSLMLAAISGEELAVARAKLALNPAATADEVAQVEALARALWAVDEVEKAKKKFGDDPMKYIKGDVSPLSGGAFDDQTARYEAEAVAEQERYTAQLIRLQEALNLQQVTREQYAAQELAFAQTHADRMAQIEAAKQQTMLAAGEKGFGAMADVLKKSQGEQSGIYKAMFAVSKAFAIAQSIVAIQTGIAQAAALPFPANLAAMAAVAAETASIVGTITSANFGGGRQYGGPVAGSGMYRINETGAPEVLNTASGKQYLLPNTRGQVVSNKDATSGSGESAPRVTVNLIEDASRGGQVEQTQGDQGQIIDVFVADIRGGGKASRAMESTYGLRRQGR